MLFLQEHQAENAENKYNSSFLTLNSPFFCIFAEQKSYSMDTKDNENKEKQQEQTYHCNDCGNVIYKHEVFCSKCGKLLDRYDFE